MPPTTPMDASYALLVLDTDEPGLRRFRSTDEPPDLTGLETTGLSELRCSASAQLSAAGFAALRSRLAHIPDELLYIVDVRQESHGLLNGAAVSWYARNNWGSVGLSADEAIALERLRLRLLEAADYVGVGRAEDVKRGLPPTIAEVAREYVSDEERTVGLPPGRYVRLPVTDHARPSDEVVARLVRFADELDARAHLHVHCRGGKGRSSTFCVLIDLLRNAHRLPLEAILDRQQRLHEYDVRKLPAPTAAKAPTIRERLAFIEAFADFARTRRRGEDWLAYVTASVRP